MPRTDWGWLVTESELASWILEENGWLLAVNKPADLVCHPSKHGPWSSLIGACREYLNSERLHLVSRLDRETSGVVVIAKQPAVARELNIALQNRTVQKTYFAILEGCLAHALEVNEPVGRDARSNFYSRQWVVAGGQPCLTRFHPVAHAGGYTLVRVEPITGRRHQIRVHASYIGHPIVGDKLYGPDETIMHRFISEGLTAEMVQQLKLPRQALHAFSLEFPAELCFRAPLPCDMRGFWRDVGGTL